jgi:hypothetical protein
MWWDVVVIIMAPPPSKIMFPLEYVSVGERCGGLVGDALMKISLNIRIRPGLVGRHLEWERETWNGN